MSFEFLPGTLSGASTVDEVADSDREEVDIRKSLYEKLVSSHTEYSEGTVTSLGELDSRLFAILSDQENPDRLAKAKLLLERYKGGDWWLHRRVPVKTPDAPNGYERVLIARHEGVYDLLVLSWSEVNSPIHDHPCERCFLMPLCGKMMENRYEKRDDGSITLVHSLPIPNYEASWIDDNIGLHSVGNVGEEIACSLHCYIPGFTRPCTIFDPEVEHNPEIGETIRVRSRAATWSVCKST